MTLYTKVKNERWVQIIEELKDYHPEGNVVPREWYTHLKFDNGKPDHIAITILSEIVYWCRPTQVRDEATGVVLGYEKKFKADLLQKSYQQLADSFGYSKYQVTEAMSRLEKRGLIKRIFRTVKTSFVTLNNVLFIDLDVGKLKQLCGKIEAIIKGETVSQSTGRPSPSPLGDPSSSHWETYTKNTTYITTEKDARMRDDRPLQGSPLPQEVKPLGDVKKHAKVRTPNMRTLAPKEINTLREGEPSRFAPSPKGSSLDINWSLPDEWRTWSIQSGMMNEEIDMTEVKFRNYWLSTNKNAVKKNWFMTWQNWCISEYEKKGMRLKVKSSIPEEPRYVSKESQPVKVKQSSHPKIQQWNELQPMLRDRIGEENYESWVERHLELVSAEDKAVFKVTSHFAKDRIIQQFGEDLAATLAKIDPKLGVLIDIQFIVKPQELRNPFPNGYIDR